MSEKDFKSECIFTRNYQELKEVVDFLVSIGEDIYRGTLNRSQNPLNADNTYFNSIKFSFSSFSWSGYVTDKTVRCITLDEFKAKYFPELIQDNTSEEVIEDLLKPGDICYVKNSNEKDWKERLFICDLGSRFQDRYLVVNKSDTENYKQGKNNINNIGYHELLTKREYEEYLKNIPAEVSIQEAEQMLKDLGKNVSIII